MSVVQAHILAWKRKAQDGAMCVKVSISAYISIKATISVFLWLCRDEQMSRSHYLCWTRDIKENLLSHDFLLFNWNFVYVTHHSNNKCCRKQQRVQNKSGKSFEFCQNLSCFTVLVYYCWNHKPICRLPREEKPVTAKPHYYYCYINYNKMFLFLISISESLLKTPLIN